MTSLNHRQSRALRRVAAATFTTALAALVLAGPAYADDTDTSPSPEGSSPSAESVLPEDPSAADVVPDGKDGPNDVNPYPDATNPGVPDETKRVKAPGKITCEDLGLGTTLMKVNGARKNQVQEGDGLRGVVVDTAIDTDGDPESLYVELDEGTMATAVVAMHGNKANIYQDDFGPGQYGPFFAPPVKGNPQPPVNHWLVCGMDEEPTESPSDTPSESPSDTPSESVPGSEAPTAPGEGGGSGGGLPVTGLALTGVIVTGLGMVGAGVAMRALRRKNTAEDGESGEGDESAEV